MAFAFGAQFLPVASELLEPLDFEFCFLLFENICFTFQNIDVYYLSIYKCNHHAKKYYKDSTRCNFYKWNGKVKK